MAERPVESARLLLKWGGMTLAAGGVLLAVATLLHPSRETASTIIASEDRLIAAHACYTLSSLLILLGLPSLYVAQRGGLGRLGLAGSLGAFVGTYLISVSGNFGFLAPVLAQESPAVINSINRYPPVVGLNAVAVITFVAGYAVLGISMTQTATLPRWAGILVAVGAPAYLLGAGIALIVSPALWAVAVLGSASLGAGLAWAGFWLWRPTTASI